MPRLAWGFALLAGALITIQGKRRGGGTLRSGVSV